MIARWPAKIRKGTTSAFTSAFWDWLPTACELAGAKTPDHVDGVSLVPAFMGETEKRHSPLFWKYEESRGIKVAVRSGNWKAIRNAADADWELYDLSSDIGEENDLATKNPELLAGLIGLLEE
jgi:arylsulfatase A-like enzyme